MQFHVCRSWRTSGIEDEASGMISEPSQVALVIVGENFGITIDGHDSDPISMEVDVPPSWSSITPYGYGSCGPKTVPPLSSPI